MDSRGLIRRNNMKLTTIIIIYFSLFSVSAFAQTYKTNYIPHGQIVEFRFDSSYVYTDTSSIFKLYSFSNKVKNSENCTFKQLIIQKVGFSVNDTLTFLSNESYAIPKAVVKLLKRNRLMVLDEDRKMVTRIIARKEGSKDAGLKIRAYRNSDTSAMLFFDVLWFFYGCPSF